MSGNRQSVGPIYRNRVQVGPVGWWCCSRPMIPGELPAAGEVRLCRKCGAAIRVQGQQLLEVLHAGDRPRRRRNRRFP